MISRNFKHKVPVISWALYDFANTIFSMNVISLYFALWLTRDQGGRDIHYSAVYSVSMILVIFLAPVLGRHADLRNRRRAALAVSTVVCVLATAAIGLLDDWRPGLILFLIANTAYQLGLVFYDGLLPSVTAPENYGRVSGFGVALGYAGSVAGMIMVAPFVQAGSEVIRSRAFVPTAVLFMVFSLPCFLWVREKKQTSLREQEKSVWRQNWETLKKYPGVPAYLVTMFFVQNAVSTVILFMGVYVSEVGGLEQSAINLFFVLATIVAVASAAVHGRLTDQLGPRRVLAGVFGIWFLAFAAAIFSPGKNGLWAAGCLVGAGLGGLWTTSRHLLLTLIPRDEAATFFGFNVLAGRFAAIAGPLLWGLVVWIAEPLGPLRYRLAVASLTVFLGAGLFCFRFIPKTAENSRFYH